MTNTDHTVSVYLALCTCETAEKSPHYETLMTDNSFLFLKQIDAL